MIKCYGGSRTAAGVLAGGLLAWSAGPAAAADFKTADGSWTLSVDGNVNVEYIYSNCQDQSSAQAVGGGLACGGTKSGSNVSNIGNGLLPAAITFGVATTQEGFDIAAHFGLYPGVATNDGGSPNLQQNLPTTCNGCSNTALGSTNLDIRQVYLTFGNKDMGTFTFGRQIGLFGEDAILNDMTLPGVGVAGSASSAAPSNTTLGSIGFGYIYTDWLAQMDYTTPTFSGFNATVGVFDPLNPLGASDPVAPKKAPGFHAKLADTITISDTTKVYVSVAFLSQQQQFDANNATSTGPYSYTGTGVDIFAKLDISDWEVFGYYYHASGLGTTALFNLGVDAAGDTRSSHGYLFQTTYKFGKAKVGFNYGVSQLDTANGADLTANPALVSKNQKGTIGVYYSLTKNLMLLAEASQAKDEAQNGNSNKSNNFNFGSYVSF